MPIRIDEERVPCPTCGAKAGNPCLMSDGNPARTYIGFGDWVPTVCVRRLEAHVDADLDGFGKLPRGICKV